MSIRTDGKVYTLVKAQLTQMGIDTSTLKIVSFGRGVYHEISLNDRIVGSYEHNSRELKLQVTDED